MTRQSAPSSAPAPPRIAVEFIGSFPDPLTRLDPPLPEIAFLGRSNVGKSSLLNALVGRRDIARVSSTPGKTQTMNVFRVAGGGWRVTGRGSRVAGRGSRVEAHGSQVTGRGREAQDRVPTSHVSPLTSHDSRPTAHDPRPFYLIDLPGYGYAKVNKGERQRFRSLVERYVGERPTVTAVVWLLDARREPSDDDGLMHDLLMRSERPILAVLTKADKLGREAQRTQTRTIERALGLLDDQVQLTSSETGLGIAELRDSIAALLAGGKEGPDDAR
jgi:GTP-binding protein